MNNSTHEQVKEIMSMVNSLSEKYYLVHKEHGDNFIHLPTGATLTELEAFEEGYRMSQLTGKEGQSN